MPGSLCNQHPLGYYHVQSNAGGEAFCVHHCALTGALPSVELQETKEGAKEAEGKGKEKVQEGEKAKEEEGARTRKGRETTSSQGIQSTGVKTTGVHPD